MGGRESRSAPTDDATASRRRRMDLYRESASFDASTYARSSGYSPHSSLSSTPTPVPSSSSTPSPPLLPSTRPLLPSTPSPPSVRRRRMDLYRESASFDASTYARSSEYLTCSSPPISSTPTPVPSSPPPVPSSSSTPSPPSVRLADNVRKDPPTKENCSSLGGATALGSGTHTDTQHTVTAEEVLDQFRDQFIKEMDAEAVVGDLLHNNIIDEGDKRIITSARKPRLQNQELHLCLRRKCTLGALMTVCDIMTAVGGNPKMLALGEVIKRRLETGMAMAVNPSPNGSALSLESFKMDIVTCDVNVFESQKHPAEAIRILYFNAYNHLIRILSTHCSAIKSVALSAVRTKQVSATEVEVKEACDLRALFECLEVDKKWNDLHFLDVAIMSLPVEASKEKGAAQLVLRQYKSYLTDYKKAVSIKEGESVRDFLQRKRGREGKMVVTEITIDKEIDEYTCHDLLDLWKLFLIENLEIPEDHIEYRRARAGNSTTLVFMITQTYAEDIKKKLSKPAAMWVMKELGILRVYATGMVSMDLREVPPNVLIASIREGLESGVDFVSLTKVSTPLMLSLLDRVPEPKETQVCSIQAYSAGTAELSVAEPVVKVPQGDTPPKGPLTQHTCSSLGAEKVLDQFRDQFIEEMEAEKVTEELFLKDIISRGDQRAITRAEDPTLQNQVLHRCLKEKCTLFDLRSACVTIKTVKGNPKMAALGDKMMRRLETEDNREGPHTLGQQRGHAVTQAPPSPFDKLRGYYTSSPVVQNSFLVGPAMEHFPRAGQDGAFAAVNLCKGGMEEVPSQRVPLDYEDIFNFKPHGGGSRRRVLVEGVPGSGKTTLVKRMCRDWANGSFAQDSKAVIQVVLRSLPKRDELTIEDMVLTSVGDNKEAEEIAQYIRDCQGDGVVFILDGYDELPEEMRQSSIVRDILKGHLAPKASFLITSRPIAAQSLYPLVDRRIEVTGFGEEEVEKYVTDYFATSDAAVGEELFSTLRSHRTIRNLCFVPLLLRMVCFMASFGKALPRTMHELFNGVVILAVNRNLEKANRKERANSLEDVKRLCPSFMKLAQLALEGLKHDTLVFSDVPFEVDEALSGLMNCIEAQNRFGVTTRTWHFLHLTLQEYFAAYALSVAPEAEQISFWSEHLLFKYSERREYILSVDRFQTMFLLYCGITGLGSTTGVQAMLVKAADAMFEPAIEDGSALYALCQAVGESRNRELARRVMSTCGSSIQVEVDGILPVGIPWCIEVYGQHTEELRLVITGGSGGVSPSEAANLLRQMKDLVTLTGLELSIQKIVERDLPHLKAIAQFLTLQRTLKHLTLKFDGLLQDYYYTFTEDEVSCFLSVLEHHSGSLESLGLQECKVSQSCAINILNKLPNLTVLNFNEVKLPANERKDKLVAGAISSAVYNHPSLKELTTDSLCSQSIVNGTVGGIVRKAGVKKLVVGGIFPDHLLPQAIHSLKNQSLDILGLQLSLNSPSTVELFRALPQSRLKEFQFTSSDRTMDDLPALCWEMEKGISGCSTLTNLSLQHLPFRHLPPQCSSASVRAAMAFQSALTVVEWSWCSFIGTGPVLKDFAVHLKHSRLRKVTFDWCRLTSVDAATLLAEGLSENRTLEQLYIYSFTSPEEVIDATLLEKVETSIESNKSLQMLYIRIKHSCVVEAVLKGARGSTSLKYLDIGLSHGQKHLDTAVAELRQVRQHLELHVYLT